MAQQYDAVSKGLYDLDSALVARVVGITDPVRVIDSNLSTVTAAADKVLLVEAELPFLLHSEVQGQYDEHLEHRLLKYLGLLIDLHHLPVLMVVVLLSKAADRKTLTGRYRVRTGFGPGSVFGYIVIRIWQEPVERFLTGSLSLLPFAPIAKVRKDAVPGVLKQVGERLKAEADQNTAGKLWAAVGILLQLRYGKMASQDLLEKYPFVRDFEVFQTFRKLDKEDGRVEGRIENAREVILLLGTQKFGSPSSETESGILALNDLGRLRVLFKRILLVNSWDELLAE